jgi:hypothetical protein
VIAAKSGVVRSTSHLHHHVERFPMLFHTLGRCEFKIRSKMLEIDSAIVLPRIESLSVQPRVRELTRLLFGEKSPPGPKDRAGSKKPALSSASRRRSPA